MSLAHLAKYALTLPPHVAAAKGGRYVGRILRARAEQVFRSRVPTWAETPEGALRTYVPEMPVAVLRPVAPALAETVRAVLEHRFDLLGSGPVRVEYGMDCAGFEGNHYPPVAAPGDLCARLSPGNRDGARKLRALLSEGYVPIDWHLDFKSGYRWSESQWHGTVAYGHLPGVDVKVPWELGRLQHLPQLALAFVLASSGEDGFEGPDAYATEFRNQTLDFLAANPPGFGVNWACAMDVAIRAANLCLARDLFVRHGWKPDAAFEDAFSSALLAHGRHVVANLEWHEAHRANHYLADVAGLLFIAAYLPRTPETDAWLAFALHQFRAELMRQFGEDGANFEASTSYHRLSGEMGVFGAALLLGLGEAERAALEAFDVRAWTGKVPLPDAPVEADLTEEHARRLMRLAEFTVQTTKPNGRVAQIGDNDSGRFFRLSPSAEDLDHRTLVGAANGLFGREDLSAFAGPSAAVEETLVAGIAKGARLDGGEAFVASAYVKTAEGAACRPRQTVIRLPDPSVLDGVEAAAYPDFGLYLWRGARFFLSVRCGPVGQNGNGGHAHNDQLAIELNVDGADWLADPGTYVYTPAPERRDAYRSVLAHAAPRKGREEPARLDLGLFRLEDRARARCLRFDAEGFLGMHRGFGEPVQLAVLVDIGQGTVTLGEGGGPPRTVEVSDAAGIRAHFPVAVPFSPAYGVVAGNSSPDDNGSGNTRENVGLDPELETV